MCHVDSLFHQLITHPHVLHLSPSDIHWDTFYLHNIFLTHTFYTSLQAISTGTLSTCTIYSSPTHFTPLQAISIGTLSTCTIYSSPTHFTPLSKRYPLGHFLPAQYITHPHILHLSPSDIHWDTVHLHNILLTHTFYTSLQAISTGTFSTCINKENTSSLAGLCNTKTQFRSLQSNKKYAVQQRGK